MGWLRKWQTQKTLASKIFILWNHIIFLISKVWIFNQNSFGHEAFRASISISQYLMYKILHHHLMFYYILSSPIYYETASATIWRLYQIFISPKYLHCLNIFIIGTGWCHFKVEYVDHSNGDCKVTIIGGFY